MFKDLYSPSKHLQLMEFPTKEVRLSVDMRLELEGFHSLHVHRCSSSICLYFMGAPIVQSLLHDALRCA